MAVDNSSMDLTISIWFVRMIAEQVTKNVLYIELQKWFPFLTEIHIGFQVTLEKNWWIYYLFARPILFYLC